MKKKNRNRIKIEINTGICRMTNIQLDTKEHLLNLFYLRTEVDGVSKDEINYAGAVIQRCSVKTLFLKIKEKSQENTYAF